MHLPPTEELREEVQVHRITAAAEAATTTATITIMMTVMITTVIMTRITATGMMMSMMTMITETTTVTATTTVMMMTDMMTTTMMMSMMITMMMSMMMMITVMTTAAGTAAVTAATMMIMTTEEETTADADGQAPEEVHQAERLIHRAEDHPEDAASTNLTSQEMNTADSPHPEIQAEVLRAEAHQADHPCRIQEEAHQWATPAEVHLQEEVLREAEVPEDLNNREMTRADLHQEEVLPADHPVHHPAEEAPAEVLRDHLQGGVHHPEAIPAEVRRKATHSTVTSTHPAEAVHLQEDHPILHREDILPATHLQAQDAAASAAEAHLPHHPEVTPEAEAEAETRAAAEAAAAAEIHKPSIQRLAA